MDYLKTDRPTHPCHSSGWNLVKLCSCPQSSHSASGSSLYQGFSSNTALLHNRADFTLLWSDYSKNWQRCRVSCKIPDTSGSTLVMDSSEFPSLWRTSMLAQFNILCVWKRRKKKKRENVFYVWTPAQVGLNDSYCFLLSAARAWYSEYLYYNRVFWVLEYVKHQCICLKLL